LRAPSSPGPTGNTTSIASSTGLFSDFAVLDADAFKECVATGATDAEVAAWIAENVWVKDTREIIILNNKMRYTRPCDMPQEL